jgi:alanyl-tRNA synthetase
MNWMSADEIRERFLAFFESKGHKRLASSPLVPNDPQLLFTVAGMVPFKPIFWGKVEPTYKRVTTCQKCIRTNDIENVGRTPRHHTFFEMLGNFSFGDYFKNESIEWAWEFLTKELKIDPDRLWPSVYIEDDEAYKIWRDKIGVKESKIMRFDKKENWWGPVGPTGPCGPCSEIYIDTGNKSKCEDPQNCSPACECGRFVEIWNIVFTEYYQDEDGKLEPLARKNIDTGAGLERISAAMQGVYNNFDSDLFQPTIKVIEKSFGIKYGESEKTDVSIKVIADHTRAVAFTVAEGVLPSNEGRGYVLRRVLRRALRHGNLLGKKEPFMSEIIDSLVERMEKIYPELSEKKEFVKKIVRAEEERFLQTLEKGIDKLNEITNALSDKIIPGAVAFELYDTYGFPIDITIEIAQEKGFKVDEQSFETFMKEQRDRARNAAGEKEYDKANQAYRIVGEELKNTVFTGYEKNQDIQKLLYIIKGSELSDTVSEGEKAELIFASTPFYAEKGGQISDTGEILSEKAVAFVDDVKVIYNEVVSHKVTVTKGTIKKGDLLSLHINEENRAAIKRNHTATHLLHSALRIVAGSHVKQAGSFVDSKRLRFDFTHFQALTQEQIEQIERIVNNEILKAYPVITEIKSLEETKNENVIALFQEKYGNTVRVVKAGVFSSELCGGTHVSNTGEIGLFKIISEASVSSGIRRIEAFTGINSYEYVNDLSKKVLNTSRILDSSSENIEEKALQTIELTKNLFKEIKRLEEKLAGQSLDGFIKNARMINNIKIICGVFENVGPDVLRNSIDIIAQKEGEALIVLFSRSDKVIFCVKVPSFMTKEHNAGGIAKKIAQFLGGGGGGKPDFAQAGGKDITKVAQVISEIEKFIF